MTEPSVPDDLWRDPSFQQLPLSEQRSHLTCARCGHRSVIFDMQDDGTVVCRPCADGE